MPGDSVNMVVQKPGRIRLTLAVRTFTDFGHGGPYLSQVENSIAGVEPAIRVTHLVTDAPAFDPGLSGLLLSALADTEGEGVFLCVIDPGVGGQRQPVVVNRGEQWFVGPDNGLFSTIFNPDSQSRIFRILYRPGFLSGTFHGRDLFAPVAARLAASQYVALQEIPALEHVENSPPERARIIYADQYGNLMTGLKGDSLDKRRVLLVGGMKVGYATRFESVGKGRFFWYVNSLGLVEIAVNQGNAAHSLGLSPGAPLAIE